MEIHSVLPEERARNEKGETLPWGYRYPDGAKNTRGPEESGPFGRNRSVRYTSSSIGAGRRHSTRQGTTPSRTKENPSVNDFSRIFAKEQASATQTQPAVEPDAVPVEKTPTECLIFGYANKDSEWKVLSRLERIVAPGIICEDYDREDPNLYQMNSPMGFNRSNFVHRDLSKEALSKARQYRGGQHWIKVTFDSYEAAERACYYSPYDIDGCSVSCEYWNGKGPMADVAVPKGAESAVAPLLSSQKAQTVGTAGGRASALAGFEQAMGSSTLPRGHVMPDGQYGQPIDDSAIDDSTTVSSGTVGEKMTERTGLRSRSVPNLPSQNVVATSSEYMKHAPKVKRTLLRPITEALPPKQSNLERILRSLPVVSWLLGYTPVKTAAGTEKDRGLIGEGPALKEDGSWDGQANGWYWSLWYRCDRIFGSDFCGLKDESAG